jgi:formylglycine-generating enzyme required for sulfatase activity
MKLKAVLFFLIPGLVFIACSLTPCFANNIAVTNVSLEAQDTGAKTYDLKFNIAWDNSWFITGAPSIDANWDAAWVFAKYSVYSGGSWSAWQHCALLNTGSSAPTGSQMTFGTTGSTYEGVFIYRSGAGAGSNNWTGAKVKWNYGTGVADNAQIKVRLFAVEMVNVPTCPFYVGDTNADNVNNFYEGATTHEFLITSEAAIAVSSEAGKLYYNNTNTYGGDRVGPIPAAFPKGYSAFYIMKYELSQRQYCEFLNTLTLTQQGNRIYNNYFNLDRYYIKLASNGKYGCDGNNNAGTWGSANYYLMNEPTDGEWVACNYLSWPDVAAYAAWAALRPFTELEFEKACRGGQIALNDEYAWGITLESATGSLTDAAASSEAPNQGNCNYSACLPNGPFRCGSYADTASSRTNAGAGFFGALDLSGSLWERPVTVGNLTGRNFTGSHGDGSLSPTGYAANADWPGSDAIGSGFRGGLWFSDATIARLSDRYNAVFTNAARNSSRGGRCARTSP